MSVVKKAVGVVGGALGLKPRVNIPETKTPAQQLERTPETTPDQIQIGSDDDTASGAKGKRALVRPVASSLGGV